MYAVFPPVIKPHTACSICPHSLLHPSTHPAASLHTPCNIHRVVICPHPPPSCMQNRISKTMLTLLTLLIFVLKRPVLTLFIRRVSIVSIVFEILICKNPPANLFRHGIESYTISPVSKATLPTPLYDLGPITMSFCTGNHPKHPIIYFHYPSNQLFSPFIHDFHLPITSKSPPHPHQP